MTTATIIDDQIVSTPVMWKTDAKSQEEESFNNYWMAVYAVYKPTDAVYKPTAVYESTEEKDIAELMQSLNFYIIEHKTSQKNLRLIQFLDRWMAEPDDLGEEFWNEFCEDIEQNRFTI